MENKDLFQNIEKWSNELLHRGEKVTITKIQMVWHLNFTTASTIFARLTGKKMLDKLESGKQRRENDNER